MRSRYSAFFFRLVDYLIETTHPDNRSQNLKRELEDTIHHTDWKFLTIVSISKGQKNESRGKVEFIADYYWDGEVQQLREHSRFRRHKENGNAMTIRDEYHRFAKLGTSPQLAYVNYLFHL